MLQIAVCEDGTAVEEYLKARTGVYVKSGICAMENGELLPDEEREFDILLVKHTQKGKGAKVSVRIKKELLEELIRHAGDDRPPREKETVLVRAGGSYYRIDPERIYYAENMGRKVVLHLKNSQIAYYAKMRETEELLGDGFFRCHRGYLVNLAAVESYEAGSILLKNGETILMAKSKYNAFSAAYARFPGRNKRMR